MHFIMPLAPNGGKIPVKLFADAKSGFIGEFLPKDVGKFDCSELIISITYFSHHLSSNSNN